MLGDDDEHPSPSGTYLAAATIYATVFGASPEGLYYPDSHVSPDDAAFLQRIAWDSVLEWEAGA